MYHFNARFSLVTSVLCLGVIFSAGAAPSVRVLGSNTGYSSSKASGSAKATAVKTGNSVKSSLSGTSSGAKKAASVKNTSAKATSVAPGTRSIVRKNATTNIGGSSTETARFPGIATKSNIQSINKVANTTTTPTSGQSGYDMQDMTNRLNNVESTVSTKADQSSVEALSAKVDALDSSPSSEYLRTIVQTVNLHTEQLATLNSAGSVVYDNAAGKNTLIYLRGEQDFDPSILE